MPPPLASHSLVFYVCFRAVVIDSVRVSRSHGVAVTRGFVGLSWVSGLV
jgi:hypothetical protein